MRYSPLLQITPGNVTELRVAWTYHLKPEGADATGRDEGAPDVDNQGVARGRGRSGARSGFAVAEATPLVVGGVMYVSSPYGRVIALDPTTGKERWVYKLPNGSPALRGVEYFAGDEQMPPQIVVATSDAKLFTLDAITGALNTKFGVGGIVNLETGTSSPAIMYRNLIIVGARVQENNGPGRSGDVHAYDIHTGNLIWSFHSIPQPGEKNFGTWAGDSWRQRSGVNVWGLMTVDVQRGIVYMPFGAPSGDLFGGDRPGDNLYGSSIVAADAKTGRYLWHFQVVHHDVFDFDLESPPVLMDIRQAGRTTPAVAVFGKSSLLFLLDRVTGRPIYSVEERKVPASDVPGEKMSPTQPFPVKPAPLARIDFTMAEIATVTPELEAACRKLIADNNVDVGKGPYAPTTYNRARVIFPSEIGGPNWGGASYSPALGYLFVNVNDLGQLNGNEDPASGPVNVRTLAGTNLPGGRTGPYQGVGPSGRFRANALTMPCQQPPWGELVAVNVNTGDIAWKVPLGVTDTLPADKQRTGRPNLGGSIATAGGLVFVGATDDARFRAFDAKDGRELWAVKLGGSAVAVPSTYQGRDGRQYVVVIGTGGSFTGAPITSDEITAFALSR